MRVGVRGTHVEGGEEVTGFVTEGARNTHKVTSHCCANRIT